MGASGIANLWPADGFSALSAGTWQVLGLPAIAILGCLLAISTCLRLVMWQRFSSLLLHTALTHGPVLWLVSAISGLDFMGLVTWDAAIVTACFMGFCAHQALARMDHIARFAPSIPGPT